MLKQVFMKQEFKRLNFSKVCYFNFSERIGSIKFIGRRNKPFYSNTESNREKEVVHTEVKKVEVKSMPTIDNSNSKSKEAELRLKVNNKLFKNFISSFENLKKDSELHNIKFTDADNEQVNMGANLDIDDWNSIKLNKSI